MFFFQILDAGGVVGGSIGLLVPADEYLCGEGCLVGSVKFLVMCVLSPCADLGIGNLV